jgi:electron transport complex protein RnfC
MIAERIIAKITNKKVFPRGIHPHDAKAASCDKPIQAIPWPEEVVIPLQQHIGAPAQLAVKPRDEVKRGDILGTAGGFVSAAVHSSVQGTVGAMTTALIPIGRRVPAVPIKTKPISDEELQADLKEYLHPADPVKPIEEIAPDAIVQAVQNAGLVGMGGATFPTHVKFKIGPGKSIDTVVLNGSECEPYLTADDRLMREAPELVVRGLLLAMRATGAKRGVIAIEDNKPKAIESMRQAIEKHSNLELAVCKAKYPMGGEKQLLPAVLGRVIPTGGLPIDVGVVVVNVATSVSLAHAVDRSRPVTHRIVTVTGAVKNPGNFYVPIGTPVSWLIQQAGGLCDDAAEVIAGGPMMGVTLPDLDIPVIKGTSGLTVLRQAEVKRVNETACLKCGRCVAHCPLKLTPTKIAQSVKLGDLNLAQSFDLMVCCECGCCSYICPARIPVVQYIKAGKAAVMKLRAQAKAKAAPSK